MKQITKDIIKRLYMRFSSIFGEKFYKGHTPELIEMWHEDWFEGLKGIDPMSFQDALNHCRVNLTWSPSIAEFREICERAAGMPTESQVFDMLLRREMAHPLVERIYLRITSWSLSNDSEKELRKKIKQYYAEEIANLRVETQQQYNTLMLQHETKKISHQALIEDRSKTMSVKVVA